MQKKKIFAMLLSAMIVMSASAVSVSASQMPCDPGPCSGGTATCTTRAICSTCGNPYGDVDANAHTGGTATCTTRAICSTCGNPYGDFAAHTYDQEVATAEHKASDATCTAKATYYKSCSCGANGQETFEYGDFAPHTGGTATCTAKAVCDNCHQEYGATNPANHAMQAVQAKDATCTEEGYTAHQKCSRCNYTTGKEIIEPLGHTPKAGYESDETYHWLYCRNGCGEQVDKAEHLFGSWQTTREASCTEEGSRKSTCSQCRKEKTEVIPMAAHNYVDGKCTVCGAKKPSSGGSSSDSSSSSSSSSSTTKPSLNVNAEIGKIKDSESGQKVEVKIEGTTVPADYVQAALSSKATLVVDYGAYEWEISDVKSVKAVDLSIDTNARYLVEQSALKSLKGDNSNVIDIAHDGNLGFKGTLKYNVKKSNAGKYVNLYYYNPTSKKLELQGSTKIGSDGNVNLPFTHCSTYVLNITVTPASNELFEDLAAGESATVVEDTLPAATNAPATTNAPVDTTAATDAAANPETGNSAVALLAIPAVIAAAAVVAKKRG